MADFIKVADIDEVKEGKLCPIEVEGEPICLANVGGIIYAFTDNCTHISGPLNEGDLEDYVITCPWHGARFDVRSGKVVRGPARQDILTYPIKIEGSSVLISLPEEA